MDSHFSLCPSAEQQQLVEAVGRMLRGLADPMDASAVREGLMDLGLLGAQLDEQDGGWGQSLATLALVHEMLGLWRTQPCLLEWTVVLTDVWGMQGLPIAPCIDQALWSERPTVRGVLSPQGDHWMLDGSIRLSGAPKSPAEWVVWFEDDRAVRHMTVFSPSTLPQSCPSFSPLQNELQTWAFHQQMVPLHLVRPARVVMRASWAILRSAELVGWSQSVLDQCVNYVQSREQFGGPIGRFQAIQHSLAKMLISVEAARSAVYGAACLLPTATSEAERWSHGAHAVLEALEASRFCTQEAIQVHGGMGYTRDCGLDRPLLTCFQIEAQLHQMTDWVGAISV
ncbi:Acyl-CoA dehydrogenase/oxidase C-terminal [Burkholderiales bacterium]